MKIRFVWIVSKTGAGATTHRIMETALPANIVAGMTVCVEPSNVAHLTVCGGRWGIALHLQQLAGK